MGYIRTKEKTAVKKSPISLDDPAASVAAKSKYIRHEKEFELFRVLSVIFMVSLFICPPYWGIPTPVFDLTFLRIMIIVLTVVILLDRERKNDFGKLLFKSKMSLFLVPYLVVITYTMVLRRDLNAFLNPFLEIYALYLCIYCVKHSLGVEFSIKMIIVFTYILTILGLYEYVVARSPFSYFVPLHGIYTGRFIRSGHYRIMSSQVVCLGYGLLLASVTPFAAIDWKKKAVDLFRHFPLLLLIMMNVFLTGSRSSLVIFIIEFVVLLFLSTREVMKKNMIILILFLVGMIGFLIVGHNTSIGQYMMLQITSMVDQIFGTSFSLQYGASNDLSSSSNYRAQLKYVYTVSWLNPLLGIGRNRSFSGVINGSFIYSLDDFYVAEYVRYAYPGLFSFALFLGYHVVENFKKAFLQGDFLSKILLVAIGGYLINLKWVDSLMTLKYLYLLFAVAMCIGEYDYVKVKSPYANSKYVKEFL